MSKKNGSKPEDDRRPDPKPRKRPHLWQAYLMHDEIEQTRIRHELRLSSIEKGKSNLDPELERAYIDALLPLEKNFKKIMRNYGVADGAPIWDWVIAIRGMGDKTSAQLIALIDDIAKFDNISKLWRFAGMAVIDGKSERRTPGEKAHFCAKLKSLCWLISDNFVKSQTPVYCEIYYEEKRRLRELHPEPVEGKYTDGHIHLMARRKMVKIFLSHLWVVWREREGLPVTSPYAEAILGHTGIIEPFPM